MKPPTAKQAKELARKRAALAARLAQGSEGLTAESLAQSYGLPVADVARALGSTSHAR